MRRNEGSNERSAVKDTIAAVRNEEELQGVWQTFDSSPKGVPLLQMPLKAINILFVIPGWFGISTC
jgi:hypothetical protein